VPVADEYLPATQRLQISDQVRANGATYEGDLTKQITHLISFRTEGAKYKAAKSWGLHIVSIEWLRDSLERGMILDEKLYDPALPPEERGKGAWDRTKPKRNSLGKRSRSGSTSNPEGGKRRLRRTASTKLGSQSESMWGDIVGGGSIAQVARSGVWEPNEETPPPKDPVATRHSDQGSNSKAPAVAADPIQGIFSRCRFYLDGFDLKKSDILSTHLIPQGADVAATLKDLLNSTVEDPPLRLFRVIPSNLPMSKRCDLPECGVQVQTITEWWVERCLHHKRFIEPQDHVIGQPFPKYPLEEFRGVTVSSAAFTGIDLLHIKRAVELLGGVYSEDMTPKSSVLVTQSVEKLRRDKLDHAQQWGIPIVTASWLWESISSGSLLPLQKHLCASSRLTESMLSDGRAVFKGNLQHARSKGGITMAVSKSDSSSSDPSAKLGDSKLDRTAFDAADRATANDKGQPLTVQTEINDSNSSTELSAATEPLSEINSNTCASAVSTAPAPTNHPAPPPREEIHNALSSLLAKTKTSSKPPDETEVAEGRRRGANRILGRATSNISATSTSFSRASSVDSTATHGRPVQYPPYSNASGHTEISETTNEQVKKFANASTDRNRDSTDSPPPATQLQYDDPESKEYQEKAMAKMMGEKFDKGEARKTRLKEKSITLGDISDAVAGARQKSRPKRDRAAPGFR
jgi:DNA replication regulator DPB11